MNQPILIPLSKIQSNPYQPRQEEDIEAITEIAINIFRNGLMQVPSARAVNGHYELVFGHTRKAAFDLLSTKGVPSAEIKPDKKFAEMPINIRELSDRQMFEMAVSENLKRRELRPTEKASAIDIYMKQFNASSKEAGELFGMNDATVRGVVRLLELPEEARAALDEGKISQGTARTLLSMQKIASKKQIVATINRIEKEKNNSVPDEVIDRAIEHLDNTVDMWDDSRRDGKPRSSWHGGWLLDMKNFPNKQLPELTPADVAIALEIQDEEKKLEFISTWMGLHSEDRGSDQALEELKTWGLEAELIEKIKHLLNPPACTACPFYTKVRGSHYCGMKTCHIRKTHAWHVNLLEDASRRSKIAIYQKSDGRFQVLDTYYHRKIFDSKSKDLRLILKSDVGGYHYQSLPGIEDDVMMVVATGETISKLTTRSSGGSKPRVDYVEQKAMRFYRQKRKALLWEFTGIAKHLFDAVSYDILQKIHSWEHIVQDYQPPADVVVPDNAKVDQVKADYLRRLMVWKLINPNYSSEASNRGKLIKVSARLEAKAKEWGVKFPKNLTMIAEQADADIESLVSTETKKAKARAKK